MRMVLTHEQNPKWACAGERIVICDQEEDMKELFREHSLEMVRVILFTLSLGYM